MPGYDADIGYDSALYTYDGDSLAVPGRYGIEILFRTRPEEGFLTDPDRVRPWNPGRLGGRDGGRGLA